MLSLGPSPRPRGGARVYLGCSPSPHAERLAQLKVTRREDEGEQNGHGRCRAVGRRASRGHAQDVGQNERDVARGDNGHTINAPAGRDGPLTRVFVTLLDPLADLEERLAQPAGKLLSDSPCDLGECGKRWLRDGESHLNTSRGNQGGDGRIVARVHCRRAALQSKRFSRNGGTCSCAQRSRDRSS